jgi:hypothetical protein
LPALTIQPSLVAVPRRDITDPLDQDVVLRDICLSAQVGLRAVAAMATTAQGYTTDGADDALILDAIAGLDEEWRHNVRQAADAPAASANGMRAKAELLRTMLGHRTDGRGTANPALWLAASIAADVLHLPKPRLS